ncbi:hypothetical protein N9K06_00145 [Omnitrophica bacterium]|nr:hypothetical protein [Candidatus Omnitrophota bacterium]
MTIPETCLWFHNLPYDTVKILLLIAAAPFLLSLMRSFFYPGFQTGQGYPFGGFRLANVVAGFYSGFFLVAWAIFSRKVYPDAQGFIHHFANDIYWLPVYVMINIQELVGADPAAMMVVPHSVWVMVFWILLCGILGSFFGRWKAPALMFLILLFAIFPFLSLLRGLGGASAYAWETSHQLVPLYPGAFSSLMLMIYLGLAAMTYSRTYFGCDEKWSRGRVVNSVCRWQGWVGVTLPVVGLIAGALIGWKGGLLSPWIEKIPVMFGTGIVSGTLLSIIFWSVVLGVFGCGITRRIYQNLFALSVLAAFLAIIILVSGYGLVGPTPQ